MLKTRFLQSLTSRLARRARPEADPRLEAAEHRIDSAEAMIRAQYPDGDLPPDVQDKLDRLAAMRSLTDQAKAADVNGDLVTLVSVAEKVRQAAPQGMMPPPDVIDFKPGLPDAAAEPGAVPIFDAIDAGDLDALADCLTTCDVNAGYGPHVVTPLVYALTHARPDIAVIIALLDAGADASLGAPRGGSALNALPMGQFDHWTTTEMLAVTRALIELEADAEGIDGEGLRPLHVAIQFQNAAALEALLRLGADPSAPVSETASHDFLRGLPPLHMAVMDPDLVDLLLIYGADISATNAAGEDALAYAEAMLDDPLDAETSRRLYDTVEILREDRAA